MKYIDLHCDTIMAIMNSKADLELKNAPLQINLDKLVKGNSLLQCFAMFVYLKDNPNPFEYCIRMIDKYYNEMAKNTDIISPVFTYEDFLMNQSNGKISALLTIEEGGVTKCDLAYLRTFYRLGVRMVCLNWNFQNGIGHPNFILKTNEKPDFKTPNVVDGLTEYGIEMVKEMNRLGMIIDVSHLSDKGFYDVLKYSTKPIVASHSNARGVCNHVRNMTDDMIMKLALNGGVMGMNFCNSFMNDNEEVGRNTIDCAIEHMLYIKNLVGVDVIAIGTDFDGIDSNIELKDASLMPKLFTRMKEVGFSEEEIEKIAYKNFLRVLKANLN